MVVFRGTIVRTFDPDFPGHTKMSSERVVAGKFEQHSLAARMRAQEFLADYSTPKLARIAPAKDAVPRVRSKIDNFRAAPRVPLFPKPLDFSQLRHRADYVGQ